MHPSSLDADIDMPSSCSTDTSVVVLIPSYNTGRILKSVVLSALNSHPDVWLLVDGSDDGSFESLEILQSSHDGFRLIVSEKNRGKGETLFQGAKLAKQEGFTHCITMDSDGQHPATYLPALVEQAERCPEALIMGKPIFDETVPNIRLQGRKLTIGMTNFESGFYGLGDTLYGFRCYPIGPFLKAFSQTRFARGYDFDPEIAVRMFWLETRPVQLEIPVRYLDASEGGISHFHYLRDNVKLTFLHFRLVPEYLFLRYSTVQYSIRKWRRRLQPILPATV